MKVFYLTIFILQVVSEICYGKFYIDDFTSNSDTSCWEEVSDSIRNGFSKASFAIQQTKSLRRAVLFTYLNPLPNGAGFSGYGKNVTLNASSYDALSIHCRNQGQYSHYQVLLRQHGETDAEGKPAYTYFFKAPTSKFDTIQSNWSDFQAYRRGKPVSDADPLDTSDITCIEILAYAGVFEDVKQSGVASLEIDWISLE